ncbi:MAG TPA: hypothetical protein VGK73_21130 [Polyangiaceae bacterium]
MQNRPRRSTAAVLVALAALGCEARPPPPVAGATEPSPNASILPAPLATGRESILLLADAGSTDASADAEAPPPELAREDQALPPDLGEPHDPSGLELKARFRWPDLGAAARLPESNSDVIERARATSTFDVRAELAATGRLHFTLESRRFVLPEGTELRARSEYFGHALVWPDGHRYVTVQPGALRTVLNEGRADTVPLAHVKPTQTSTGKALGFPTERTTLASALGTLELEQARLAGSAGGGPLLCRLLVELAGVHPDTPACASELVPVRAEYAWNEGGRLLFEATSLNRVAILDPSRLATPPPTAEHRIGELPSQTSPVLLDRDKLRSFRLKPVPTREAKDAPKEGLLVVNGEDLPRFLLVDGVPALRLLPRGSGVLLELVRGTYALSTRTFLGDELETLGPITVPGRLTVREPPRSEP